MPASSPPDTGRQPALAELLPRCTFAPAGSDVTCAVSGGADSSALLVLAVAAGCRVEAVHVDHGLRQGSAAEADVVRALASRLGATFRRVRVEIAPGPNLEARARAARYAALPADVVTGHTAEDQAETILLNLLRGSAAAGLAGMRPGPRRPLLALRRAETEALCAAMGLTVVDDPSNSDRRHLRNTVRHDVLPLLAATAGRDIVPILCRQADVLRDDEALLDELAGTLDPTDAQALSAAPVPLARRAVRRWVAAHDPSGHRPGLAAVERVLDVAAGRAEACDVGGGIRVRRSRQRLQLLLPPGNIAARCPE